MLLQLKVVGGDQMQDRGCSCLNGEVVLHKRSESNCFREEYPSHSEAET